MALHTNNNNGLDAVKVPGNIYNAIKNAAQKTGVNFTYLMEKAAVESSFNPNAKARTSSATGLFQFIDSTWLKMVKEHGDKYGLEKYADKITDDGRVRDASAKKEILNLRKDPEIASLMAAEFAQGNYEYLQKHVGGNIGKTELYLAHFLGAGGASGFLTAMKKSPNMTAADIFPKEARSNRNVFYDSKTGAPRSLREVYAFFDRKFDDAPANNNSIMTAQNSLRMNKMPVTDEVANDPFQRLAALMGTAQNPSMLRMQETKEIAQKDLQILPSKLYGNLSLSPAQMMLLTDFTA
jgi:hypothetical protein